MPNSETFDADASQFSEETLGWLRKANLLAVSVVYTADVLQLAHEDGSRLDAPAKVRADLLNAARKRSGTMLVSGPFLPQAPPPTKKPQRSDYADEVDYYRAAAKWHDEHGARA